MYAIGKNSIEPISAVEYGSKKIKLEKEKHSLCLESENEIRGEGTTEFCIKLQPRLSNQMQHAHSFLLPYKESSFSCLKGEN